MKRNVKFVSNLYPIGGKDVYSEKHNDSEIPCDDVEFCHQIEDPKRLFEMKCNPRFKYFNFTRRQESIFRVQSGLDCRKNPDNMPFGAVVLVDETESGSLIKEICKCNENDCEYYEECMEVTHDLMARGLKEKVL